MATSTSPTAWAAVRDALAGTTPRFAELLRTVCDPTARAVGDWTIAETVAHVAVVCAADAWLARGDLAPPASLADLLDAERLSTATIADVAVLNRRSLERETERDPGVLADRIEHEVDALLTATVERTGSEPLEWLGGVELPASSILVHLHSELLVHGFDIARAERRSWDIESSHAVSVYEQFFLRFLKSAGGDRFVEENTHAARDVRCEFRVRGSTPVVFALRDGRLSIDESRGDAVDVRVTADAAVMLLVMYRRIKPLLPLLRRQLTVSGRRPWRLPRLMNAIQTP